MLSLLAALAIVGTDKELTIASDDLPRAGRAWFVGVTTVESALPGALFVSRIKVDGVEVASVVSAVAGDVRLLVGVAEVDQVATEAFGVGAGWVKAPRVGVDPEIELTGEWTAADPSNSARGWLLAW